MGLKLIWYDIKRGMSYNGIKLLLPLGVGITATLIFISRYKMGIGNVDGATFLECAMYLYKGGKYLPPERLEMEYTIPAIWLLLQIVIGYLVGSYSTEDIHTYGQQVLIRSRSRKNWWISKCIWNVVTVLYCYIALNLALIMTCAVCGVDISLTYSDEVFTGYVLEMWHCTGTMREVLVMVFVMPVVVSVASSLLQMTLTLIVSPIVGFIVIQIMAIMSTMVMHPILFHNFAMLAHSNIASPTNFSIEMGMVVSAIVVGVSVISGKLYFDKYNVLSKG